MLRMLLCLTSKLLTVSNRVIFYCISKSDLEMCQEGLNFSFLSVPNANDFHGKITLIRTKKYPDLLCGIVNTPSSLLSVASQNIMLSCVSKG
jgi:hypothetical protein